MKSQAGKNKLCLRTEKAKSERQKRWEGGWKGKEVGSGRGGGRSGKVEEVGKVRVWG